MHNNIDQVIIFARMHRLKEAMSKAEKKITNSKILAKLYEAKLMVDKALAENRIITKEEQSLIVSTLQAAI